MGQPSHGTILFIQEILEDPAAHTSVRTFGKYDAPPQPKFGAAVAYWFVFVTASCLPRTVDGLAHTHISDRNTEEGVRCRLQGVDAAGEGEGFTLEDEGGRTLAVDATLLSDQVLLLYSRYRS